MNVQETDDWQDTRTKGPGKWRETNQVLEKETKQSIIVTVTSLVQMVLAHTTEQQSFFI